MRFRGQEYDGDGISIAIIDSGINAGDPRLSGATIEGWYVELGATNHALIGSDFRDENGHGTEIAVAVHHLAPKARLVAVRIMDDQLRTSAHLMAAGIESASKQGCQVISLSLGTPDMGKAMLLQDSCANAVDQNSVVLAAAHPKGERVYPAELREAVGVASHPECPLDKFYYFSPHRFPRRDWGHLSGKFLSHGYGVSATGERGPYRGSGVATAYLAARVACLRQALPDLGATAVVEMLRQLALTPVPEIGFR